MIQNIEHIILTLQLVNSNGNTNFLLTLGYDFVEISKFISLLRKKKYIEFKSGHLKLTESGRLYLNDLNKELNRKGLDKNISPLIQYKTDKMDKFEVYFPINLYIKVGRE